MQRLRSLRSWIPPLAAFAGGIVLLILGVVILVVLSFRKFQGADLAFELTRELAISFTIAGLVACLFEIYHHITYQMRTTSEVIDAVMGGKITPEVWSEVKNLMERRSVIRRDARIRLSLQRDARLQEHEAILRVEHDYNLCGLSSRRASIRTEHELDYHIENRALELPRFEYVEVNPPGPNLLQWDREKLKTEFPNGTFSCEVPVEQSDGQPVHIQTQRLELVRLPGSYNFYSAEFVKGLQLTFGEWPTDVEFDVQVRPLGKGMDIKSGQKTCSCDALLLPGQGIEIRFFEKVIPAVQEAIV